VARNAPGATVGGLLRNSEAPFFLVLRLFAWAPSVCEAPASPSGSSVGGRNSEPASQCVTRPSQVARFLPCLLVSLSSSCLPAPIGYTTSVPSRDSPQGLLLLSLSSTRSRLTILPRGESACFVAACLEAAFSRLLYCVLLQKPGPANPVRAGRLCKASPQTGLTTIRGIS
jgi:hypothetical protein